MARKKQNVRTTNLGTVYPARKRWAAKYERPARVYHSPGHTFATYKLADDWLREEYDLIHDKYREWTPPAQRRKEAEAKEAIDAVTVAEAARTYIDQRVTRGGRPLEPSTKRKYASYIHFLGKLAEMPLNKVTPADVSTWWNKTKLAESTRQKTYSFGKSVFKQAKAMKLIDEVPFNIPNTSRAPRKKTKQERAMIVEAVSIEDMTAMLADYEHDGFRLALELLAWAGFRSAEVFALTPDCFKKIESAPVGMWQVSITKATKINEDKQQIVGPPKTEYSYRTVPIPPHLTPHLEQRLKATSPGAPLFPSTTKRYVYTTSQQVTGARHKDRKGNPRYNRWVRVTNEHGHPEFRVHDLRHWARLIWTRTGLPSANVKMLLGQELEGMDAVYAHQDQELLIKHAIMVSELAGWQNPVKQAAVIDPRMFANMTPEKQLEALQAMTGDQLAANAETLKQMALAATRARLEHEEDNSGEQEGRQAQ